MEVGGSGSDGGELGTCLGCVLGVLLFWWGLKIALVAVAALLYLLLSPFLD